MRHQFLFSRLEGKAMTKPRVLLVQRILTPYRLPFFRRLAASPRLSLTVAYGDAAAGSALESVTAPCDLDAVRLGNLYGSRREIGVWQQGLLSLVQSKLYDIVIAEFNPRIVSNVLGCVWRKRLPMQWIWWGHGVSPRSGTLSIRLRLWLSRLADALIFYDTVQQAKFISWGVAQEKTFVAPNSIETELIDPLIESRPREGRNRILYIGRLTERKKVDLLIRGFEHACPQLPPDTRLTIIGEGPERQKLTQLATQLGVSDHVEFVGSLYQQEQLAPWFNSAWVSVSPGAIGLSAVHSLAYGVPLIIARNEAHGPEVGAIVEGEHGLFFDSDDVAGLSAQLLSLSRDSERWTQMTLAARGTVQERFSLHGMVNNFEQAIRYVRPVSAA
jgi:glycosyltransferase involved in cell wall biosynthesis